MTRFRLVGALAGALLLGGACVAGEDSDLNGFPSQAGVEQRDTEGLCDDGMPHPGCACRDDQEEVRAVCGRVEFEVAGQITCGYGETTCEDGEWGECIVNNSVGLHPGGTTDVQKVIMSRRIGIGRNVREQAGRLR